MWSLLVVKTPIITHHILSERKTLNLTFPYPSVHARPRPSPPSTMPPSVASPARPDEAPLPLPARARLSSTMATTATTGRRSDSNDDGCGADLLGLFLGTTAGAPRLDASAWDFLTLRDLYRLRGASRAAHEALRMVEYGRCRDGKGTNANAVRFRSIFAHCCSAAAPARRQRQWRSRFESCVPPKRLWWALGRASARLWLRAPPRRARSPYRTVADRRRRPSCSLRFLRRQNLLGFHLQDRTTLASASFRRMLLPMKLLRFLWRRGVWNSGTLGQSVIAARRRGRGVRKEK